MILTLLIVFYLVNGCRTETVLVPVGDAKIVQRLDNGNYEVTSAFIIWVFDLKAECDILKLEVKKLRELIERGGKQ